MKPSSTAAGWFVAGAVVTLTLVAIAQSQATGPVPPPPESALQRVLKHPLTLTIIGNLVRALGPIGRMLLAWCGWHLPLGA